ncbi:MAG: RagB/SusD family nutrient uptake outer membrane protein, partial [Bacteroides sp.]
YSSDLKNSRNQSLFHDYTWRSGMTLNDDNTDNLFSTAGNLDYFAGAKQVPSGKSIQTPLERVRTWNWFLEQVLPKEKAGIIQGDPTVIRHYIGEAYFFRAIANYYALVRYGDFPIIQEVLVNDAEILKKKSIRAPRNEVARAILKDLDEAISRLKDMGFLDNQRINKQSAQLFKSRVALFEATFEKYHKGTGRVPGDATWPGKNMAYNQGKTFNIQAEIDFFLSEAMNASKAVADRCALVPNSHVMNPVLGQINGWNPYFEMFGIKNLKDQSEVILWKEYSRTFNITHDVPSILAGGGDQLGITRSYVTTFLMKNGLPYYAANSGFKGDLSVSMEKENRDERLQLFVFSEKDALKTDLTDQLVIDKKGIVCIDTIPLVTTSVETRDYTGYRPRKFYTYDFDQYKSNAVSGTTAAIIFRATEAYLNYIEASYEKKGSLDADAIKYWKALRNRAGVNDDIDMTINNTDLDKEANIVNGTVFGDLAVYSGDAKVNATLYNIRRERRCEFLSEGMRWDDLKRWRSWDKLITGHYMLEGMNLWDDAYKLYVNKDGKSTIVADGSTESNMSAKSVSKYIRPMGRTKINNDLFNGYTWRKAYYLEPIGVQDMQLTASDPENIETTAMYQNPYWPSTAGKALE